MEETETKAQQAYTAILAVLENASAPLSCGELIDRAISEGKLQGTRKEWEPTVQAKLFYEVSKAKNSRIYKPSTGRFDLSSRKLSASTPAAIGTSSDSDEIAKLREEVKALREENAALKSLVKRYMT